jgi:hypothetical protein
MRLVSLISAAWVALAGFAQAEEVVVVELFTSQGCSSCPPADKILGQLAEEDNVVALAMHVDYWDYLGWKDEFASPDHTKRQRAYARAKGERTIYTPQMVIGGTDHVVGSRAMKVSSAVRKHENRKLPVSIDLARNGNQVVISADARGNVPDMVVQVVTYMPEATVKIRRGENAGRTITYHNVVRDLVTLGSWNGQGEYKATARVPSDMPVVVLVQAKGAGPIMGASRLK